MRIITLTCRRGRGRGSEGEGGGARGGAHLYVATIGLHRRSAIEAIDSYVTSLRCQVCSAIHGIQKCKSDRALKGSDLQ